MTDIHTIVNSEEISEQREAEMTPEVSTPEETVAKELIADKKDSNEKIVDLEAQLAQA